MKRRTSRLLSVLLALCMVLAMLPATAVAATPDSGTCGDNLTWQLENGILTISGYGDMFDYSGSDPAPWYYKKENITSLVIENGATSIGRLAFDECSSLTNVTIPDSVTSIGELAFFECRGLTSVTIPNSVTSIGSSAFERCSGLISATIGNNVATIGSYAFRNCSSLTSVTILDGVTSIEYRAFEGCSSLTSITIPNSVTTIGDSAFADCSSLTSVTVPVTTSIGWRAFLSASYVRLTGVGEIGPLSTWCNATTIDIESGVTSIGQQAFYKLRSLTSVTIPNSVTNIGNSAFEGCSSLTCVTIPNSVTSIGSFAFDGCSGLTSITIPKSITSIGFYVFGGCSSLTSVTIPNSVTSIGERAFSDCSSLTGVTIPNSVTSIGYSAFSDCSGLTSVTIPNSVTSIGNFAFENCNSLTDVYYSGAEADWKAISIGIFNENLTNANIHYNSTIPEDDGPDDDGSDSRLSVHFLSGWDSSTWQIRFGDPKIISPYIYTFADSVDVSGIDQLLNKYVLVTMEQGDSVLEYTITDIQPVDSSIGVISAAGTHTLTIDGTEYPVSDSYSFLDIYVGSEVLFHTYEGTIVGINLLQEKTGTLEDWDSATGRVTIDGQVYPTNYLSDVSLLDNVDKVIGKKIVFLLVDNFNYNPVLSLRFCPGFYFSTNAATNSIENGATFDLYVGYYFDDGSLDSKSKDFVSVVSDNNVVEIVPAGWSDKYGQHYTAKAKGAGNATFTVTNSHNNDAASLNLYVIEKEYGYNFDNVPKLTYEEGKVTNFYNHNGMIVDDFTYTPHKNESGEVDYYVVTMDIYNTLDLYGAVTAYNADGNPTGFYLIDKKGVLPSNFTHTVEDLYYEIGDLFYLIDNSSYYSGKSISKKTEVTINVPVGGYIEISNSIYSEVALCANIIGLL